MPSTSPLLRGEPGTQSCPLGSSPNVNLEALPEGQVMVAHAQFSLYSTPHITAKARPATRMPFPSHSRLSSGMTVSLKPMLTLCPGMLTQQPPPTLALVLSEAGAVRPHFQALSAQPGQAQGCSTDT